MSPIVVTVEQDQTINLPLDLNFFFKLNCENKYQTPNVDTLIDSILKIITNYQTESSDDFFGSTIDLKYA